MTMTTDINFKSTKELVGCYLASRWNGMSNIWKVVKSTPKTVTLTEIKWVGDPDADHSDPIWKPCKISFIGNSNEPELERKQDWYAPGKMRLVENTKKKVVKFGDDGLIQQFHIGWDNQDAVSVVARNDEEAKSYRFLQYWD